MLIPTSTGQEGTARYEKGGESLLVLLPSEEEEMVRLLEEKKIPIQQIR